MHLYFLVALFFHLLFIFFSLAYLVHFYWLFQAYFPTKESFIYFQVIPDIRNLMVISRIWIIGVLSFIISVGYFLIIWNHLHFLSFIPGYPMLLMHILTRTLLSCGLCSTSFFTLCSSHISFHSFTHSVLS